MNNIFTHATITINGKKFNSLDHFDVVMKLRGTNNNREIVEYLIDVENLNEIHSLQIQFKENSISWDDLDKRKEAHSYLDPFKRAEDFFREIKIQ